MTCAFAPPTAHHDPMPASILIDAVRCWRQARDAGHARLPALYALLEPHGWGLLSPVLDGLFMSIEAALGRTLDVERSRHAPLTSDELPLLALPDFDSPLEAGPDGPEQVAAIARWSATWMMRSLQDMTGHPLSSGTDATLLVASDNDAVRISGAEAVPVQSW